MHPPNPYDSESIIIEEMNSLIRDLLRVIDGQQKLIAFEPCYRRCYNLIVQHKRGNDLDKKLVCVWRALSTIPLTQSPKFVKLVEDVLMQYKIWRTAKKLPSVAELATNERVARAKQTIKHFLLENYYKPGGVFERNRNAEWGSKAWHIDHVNKKLKHI